MARFSDCDPYAILDGEIVVELDLNSKEEEIAKRVTSYLCDEGLLDYDFVKEHVWDNFDWDEKDDDEEE